MLCDLGDGFSGSEWEAVGVFFCELDFEVVYVEVCGCSVGVEFVFLFEGVVVFVVVVCDCCS